MTEHAMFTFVRDVVADRGFIAATWLDEVLDSLANYALDGQDRSLSRVLKDERG